jgi:hypothetical protein
VGNSSVAILVDSVTLGIYSPSGFLLPVYPALEHGMSDGCPIVAPMTNSSAGLRNSGHHKGQPPVDMRTASPWSPSGPGSSWSQADCLPFSCSLRSA